MSNNMHEINKSMESHYKWDSVSIIGKRKNKGKNHTSEYKINRRGPAGTEQQMRLFLAYRHQAADGTFVGAVD